jgi:hypothetical protein
MESVGPKLSNHPVIKELFEKINEKLVLEEDEWLSS